MKQQRQCPKCESCKLWVINPVAREHVTECTLTEPLGRFSSGATVRVGTFEAWICVACGFTEWYACDVNEGLAMLSHVPQSGVLYYNGIADGPYR